MRISEAYTSLHEDWTAVEHLEEAARLEARDSWRTRDPEQVTWQRGEARALESESREYEQETWAYVERVEPWVLRAAQEKGIIALVSARALQVADRAREAVHEARRRGDQEQAEQMYSRIDMFAMEFGM
ncbi:hypothetical protein ACFL59_09550 [Planctomycetota bacterium]